MLMPQYEIAKDFLFPFFSVVRRKKEALWRSPRFQGRLVLMSFFLGGGGRRKGGQTDKKCGVLALFMHERELLWHGKRFSTFFFVEPSPTLWPYDPPRHSAAHSKASHDPLKGGRRHRWGVCVLTRLHKWYSRISIWQTGPSAAKFTSNYCSSLTSISMHPYYAVKFALVLLHPAPLLGGPRHPQVVNRWG